MALGRAELTTAFRDYIQVLRRRKTQVVEEEAPVIKKWTGRQLTRREALEMRRRIKTPVELSREERQLRLRTSRKRLDICGGGSGKCRRQNSAGITRKEQAKGSRRAGRGCLQS